MAVLQRLRARLSYANVMATVAVFIALGGTGYTATQLPRNSVGEKQIRPNAVGKSELRSRSVTASELRARAVTLSKISRRTLRQLRGATGPVGPPGAVGPQGPAGASAVILRASITSGGAAVGGNSRGAAHNDGTTERNEYRVLFDRPVTDCTPTATLARLRNGTATEDPPAGRIIVAVDGDRVIVRTFAADGSPAELPFNVVVAC